MNLRVRLIVAFFLLSVVPLGAVTYHTYQSNASTIRDAAGREAHLLAGELTDRMTIVTSQLSQRFVQLMEIPPPVPVQAAAPPPAPVAPAKPKTRTAATRTAAVQKANPDPIAAAEAAPAQKAVEATQVAQQLGEVAILLNNIEIRGFGRGRSGGFGAGFGGGRGSNGPPPPAGQRASGGQREGDLTSAAAPPPAAAPDRPPSDAHPDRRRGDRGAGSGARGIDGPPSPPEPPDPGKLQIDLRPLRREILQQIFPDRERFDQLSREERDLILGKVNERMLGIQQGIQILQQKASEQATGAKVAAEAASANSDSTKSSAEPAPTVAPAPKPSTASKAAVIPKAPAAPTPNAAEAPAPAPPAAPAAPPLQRKTALAGSRMDVRVMRNGEV